MRLNAFSFVALTSGLACGPSAGPSADPGKETGECVDNQCLGDLMCLSNLCVDPDATPGSGGVDDDGGQDAPGDDGDGDGASDDTGGVTGTPPSTVSVLFVVDNSGSMAEEQATLAASVQALVDPLLGAGIDFRIGVTTSDNGNPWCTGTGPEGGNLVASSCRTRTQDFVFQGAVMVDATQEACLDVCPQEAESIAYSAPWIESIGGRANTSVDLVTALQCTLPQGINGCGFEEQLESMNKALRRANLDGEDEVGFLEGPSLPVVVIVTDEVDCSFNKDHETIFLPDGNRVFWSNPEDAAPTSALCWNAGVECTGSGTYDECHSVNLDVDGNPVAEADAEDAAALQPVSRYTDYLQAIENDLQTISPATEALVFLIAGVNADGTVTYADSQADPGFQTDFGIGPGCQSASGTAVPPVRMREFAEAFQVGDAQNRFSVCDDSYAPAFEAIAEAILDQVAPG